MEELLAGTFFMFALLGWLLPLILSMVVASSKGRSVAAGFFLGLFLGWIGFIIVCCMTNFKALRTNVNVQVGSNVYTPSSSRGGGTNIQVPETPEDRIRRAQGTLPARNDTRRLEDVRERERPEKAVTDVTPKKKSELDELDEQITKLKKQKELRELQTEEAKILEEKEKELKALQREEEERIRGEQEKERLEQEAEEEKRRQQELEEKRAKLAKISKLKKDIADLENGQLKLFE